MPDFSYEMQFLSSLKEDTPNGILSIAGVDEVGRGSIAGCVVAAAVILKPSLDIIFLNKIQDSKKLTKKMRDELNYIIRQHSFYAVAEVDVETIDKINILQASLLAMNNAVKELSEKTVVKGILIDGNQKFNTHLPTQTLVKGDSKSLNIASASILAKVYRDNKMQELAKQYSHYNWEQNVGYGTAAHLNALKQHGITKYHRKSFAPCKYYL